MTNSVDAVAILNAIESYKTIIGWALVVLGWTVSNMIAFRYGMKKSWHDKALAVFEEVSVLIEGANRLNNHISASILAKEPLERRAELWREYRLIQARVHDNTPRMRYLIQTYFGTSMRETFDWVWDQLVDSNSNVEQYCESEMQPTGEGITSYLEGWEGSDEKGMSLGKYRGLKWRMMKHLNKSRARALLDHERARAKRELGEEIRQHGSNDTA